ncbi:MAG: hypothetical protein KIH01_09085, partial [Candidatus Freyarchaeota archaeon]|nr:hypothetical protein [Candidatus Jordarchaeia archaeon]
MSKKPVYGIEWGNLVIDYEQPISEEALKSMTLKQLFEMVEHMEYIYLYYRYDAYREGEAGASSRKTSRRSTFSSSL